MVAVTVVLAASVSVFVIGLGEQVSDPAPSATITTEQAAGGLSFVHQSGDPIEVANLGVTGADCWIASDERVEAGDRIEVVPQSGQTRTSLVWDDGQTSATLTTAAVDRTVALSVGDCSARERTTHTFHLLNPSFGEPDGSMSRSGDQVNKITVDYPDGASLSGLDSSDITVTMTRLLSRGLDTDEITVNSGSYSGSTATFNLSGRFDTDVAGPIIVEIDGIENADPGAYTAELTLKGDAPDKTFKLRYVVTESE